MRDQGPALSLVDFTEELAAAFGPDAITRTIALMLAARDKGMIHQEDILTSAAIMLCGPKFQTL